MLHNVNWKSRTIRKGTLRQIPRFQEVWWSCPPLMVTKITNRSTKQKTRPRKVSVVDMTEQWRSFQLFDIWKYMQSIFSHSDFYNSLQNFSWADHLAQTDHFEHASNSDRNNAGENLFKSSGLFTYKYPAWVWYSEISNYDFSHPGYLASQETGLNSS